MRRQWQGIPVTELRSPDGACAVVADHGAHLLSWIPASADAQEALFLSPGSGFGAGTAIRGGVPIIFPQFGERGSGRRHGFARACAWRQRFAGVEQGRAVARYLLTDADVNAADWPCQFSLEYEVALHAGQLQLTLAVTNTDRCAWQFTAALHTYLQVSDVARIELAGLRGLSFIDQAANGAAGVQRTELLRIAGEVDRIYAGIPGPLHLADGARRVTVRQAGFADAVVWNPGALKAAALSDLTAGTESRFVCIEAGAVLQAITLAPGETWQGSQTIEKY